LHWLTFSLYNAQYFNQMIFRWRLHIRKALSPQVKDDSRMDEVKETVEGDDDERMLSQMEELHSIYEQKKKKTKKILAKRRAKVGHILVCNLHCRN
jgi:hypothetical protein